MAQTSAIQHDIVRDRVSVPLDSPTPRTGQEICDRFQRVHHPAGSLHGILREEKAIACVAYLKKIDPHPRMNLRFLPVRCPFPSS